MQKYLLDTNILLHYLRGSQKCEEIEADIHLLDNDTLALISVVTVAEIHGFLQRSNWGKPKKDRLNKLLARLIILDISSRDTALLDAYATIHNYSKNLLPDKPLGHSLGIQNNDVWIAATAMVANAILVTTDSDFDHLNRAFLTVLKFTAQ